MFLTQGVTNKWPQYKDPRCHNVTMGVHHALSSSLLGLSVHTEDLLRDETQVGIFKLLNKLVVSNCVDNTVWTHCIISQNG